MSLLDSPRSKPHQFAFDPSRDASADSGFLLGLAASTIPGSLLPEGCPQRDAYDRFVPPTTSNDCTRALGSRIAILTQTRGMAFHDAHSRFGGIRLDFEEGSSPCLRPFAILPLTSLSLSGFPSHHFKWASGTSIEPRPFFPAFREECAAPNDQGCLPSVALELSSVCTIPDTTSVPVRFSVAVWLGAASTMSDLRSDLAIGSGNRPSLNYPRFA